MANKRDSNSQKRSRANRAQREALRARTTAAGTPRPSRAAPAASRRAPGARGPVRSTPAEAAAATTKGGRQRAPRPPKPGDVPVDIDTLEGTFIRKVAQVPGGTQATQGTLFTILAGVFTIVSNVFVHQVNSDGLKTSDKGFVADQTLFARSPVLAIVPPLLMAILAGLAFRASLGPNRRRAWVLTAFVAGLLVAALGQILFLFSAGVFVWAYMRANKIEGPEPLFFRGRGRAAGRTADDAEPASDDPDGDDED